MSNPAEEYKLALEEEIKRWHGFWRALRKNDREAFEAMMDTAEVSLRQAAGLRSVRHSSQ